MDSPFPIFYLLFAERALCVLRSYALCMRVFFYCILDTMTQFAVNKKARHDYTILDSFEAGVVLSGHEVKSVRSGSVNLKGSYISISPSHEVMLHNAHIAPYTKATHLKSDYEPTRSRKLLLHKKEIMKLIGMLAQKGLTLMPLSLYSKGNRIKVEVGVAQGKKKADKREDLKKRDIQRDLDRTLRYS